MGERERARARKKSQHIKPNRNSHAFSSIGQNVSETNDKKVPSQTLTSVPGDGVFVI